MTCPCETKLKDIYEQLGKASSHAFNAEVSSAVAAERSEATEKAVKYLEKLLYQWHMEDDVRYEALQDEVDSLKTWKAKTIGAVTGAVFIATGIVSGMAWAIHYLWDIIVNAFRGG